MEYPKIDTPFERDDHFIVDPSKLKQPVLGTIREWDVTEKIDGTNVRVMLDLDGTVRIGGRTDNAQMPTDLVQSLIRTFSAEKMQAAFWLDGTPVAAILYGEGYGAGIQKGGGYRKDKAFRLFDVLVNGKWWLEWDAVCDVAQKLGIATVPYLGRFTLEQIVEAVRNGFASFVASAEKEGPNSFLAEGIVARPIQPLFDKQMRRIIIKLKTKDFGPKKRGSS